MSSGRCARETFGRAHCHSDSRAHVIVMSDQSVAPRRRGLEPYFVPAELRARRATTRAGLEEG